MRTRRKDNTHLHIALSLAGIGLFVVVGLGTIYAFVFAGSSTGNQPQAGNVNVRPAFSLPIPGPSVRNPNPTAAAEGMSWSLKDVGEHLLSKGVISAYELPENGGSVMMVRTKDGGGADVERHNGAISAERFAEAHANKRGHVYPAYTWGSFTISNHTEIGKTPGVIAASLPGSVRYGLYP